MAIFLLYLFIGLLIVIATLYVGWRDGMDITLSIKEAFWFLFFALFWPTVSLFLIHHFLSKFDFGKSILLFKGRSQEVDAKNESYDDNFEFEEATGDYSDNNKSKS